MIGGGRNRSKISAGLATLSIFCLMFVSRQRWVPSDCSAKTSMSMVAPMHIASYCFLTVSVLAFVMRGLLTP